MSENPDFEQPILDQSNTNNEAIHLEEDFKPLWANVLLQACNDIKDSNELLSDSTEFWLNSDNAGIGSLIWICTILELDISAVKKKLLEMKKLEGINNER